MAFSIGRAVGPAVVRNRLRRRLRELLREADANEPLPPVIMLIGATPRAAELTYEQLRLELATILDSIRQARRPAERP